MTLFRRNRQAVGGEFIEYRERYEPHDCRPPGASDQYGNIPKERPPKGLGHGTRWRCRSCRSEWDLSNYYRNSWTWYRMTDPRKEEFDRTHDEDGRLLSDVK